MWKAELEDIRKLAKKKYNLGLDRFALVLAKELGVSDQTVYNWLNGKFQPRKSRKAQIRAVIKKMKDTY